MTAPNVQLTNQLIEHDADYNPTIKIQEHGFVTLINHMGDDLTTVNAAKVSFADQSEEWGDHEEGLSNYLMRNRHGSVFEHSTMTFRMRAPLFVLYEYHRHRAGHSFNEESARYTKMRSDFRAYTPEQLTTQVGKPGAYTFENMLETLPLEDQWTAHESADIIEQAQRFAFRQYNKLLELGVSKQQARVVLPVGMYKEQWATMNLRALMNFLGLRLDINAQEDIREYANALYLLAAQVFPNSMRQFAEHGFVSP